MTDSNTSSWSTETFGQYLVNSKGEKKVTSTLSLEKKDLILLYFSASWGSVNTCNAVIVRSFAAKIAGAASDVCLLQSVRGACNRARHIDVVYRKWINTVARGHERSVTHGQRNGHVNGRNSVREERNDEGFMSASICI